MNQTNIEWQNAKATPSPLVLCDRLITLAKDADLAGYAATAERLVRLAHTVLSEKRKPS